MDSSHKVLDRRTPPLAKNKLTRKRVLLLAASTFSLIAAGAAVCGLFSSINDRTHTTTTSTTTSITTTTTTTTTGLRQPPTQPAVIGYEAAATVETASGGEADGGGHQALSAGYTFLPVILRRQDHRKSPIVAEIAVESRREEAPATLQRVNASDRTQTAGDQGARGEWNPPLVSRPLVDDQPFHNAAEAAAAATAMVATRTRRATVAEEGDVPGGLSEPEPKRSTSKTRVAHDSEAISDVGEGDGICSPLEVVGLRDCPELNPDGDGSDLGGNAIIKKMLDTKADMLRQVIEVLTDPASAGQGGNPDEPLLLVQKLAVDETDAIFGAFEKEFLGHAVDASSWSPLPGGFNRWVELYYRTVLRETRPVLITVHGDDVCALEKELSLEARLQAADVNGGDIDGTREGARMASSGGDGGSGKGTPNPSLHVGESREDFEAPVALMTLGWDPAGDPTHKEVDRGRDRACVLRVLEMNRVVRWFTSHARPDSHTDQKFAYMPLGFGGYETRNGLPHTAYIDAAKHRLKVLETCPVGETGRYDLLLQCNMLDRPIREVIWKEMTEGKGQGSPIPVNRAPLGPADMVTATTKGIFTVSPPGTGPDCFRHYEVMLEGNIALVQDTNSMRYFMGGLPSFFIGGHGEPWGSLTCGRLLEMAEKIQATIKEGKENNGGGLQFEKLTHGFWRAYVRREVLQAGGVNDESATATYVERSVTPLNPHGWTTFHRVGCFAREEEQEPQDQNHPHLQLSVDGSEHVVLRYPDRTPEGCAAHCSLDMGGGVGFFGIGSGDECWCDEIPGNFLPMDKCNMDCDGEYGEGSCGGDYASSVYVFGPEEKGAPFEYMGCFPSTEHFMFHAAVGLGKASTPFTCEAFCTSMRYPFFAVENSDLCRCGVMLANTPRSDRVPAYMEGGGYEPIPGPPNATRAAKPSPEGVHVGDPRFRCHEGRCRGNSEMWGCGAEKAYDLYRNIEPCVLYGDC